MSFEDMFKAKGDDVNDVVREDMSVVGDDAGKLKTFEPNTGEGTDVMPPLPEEKDATAEFIRNEEARIKRVAEGKE